MKVAIAVTTLFRDYGYRAKRSHARLKFLVADWGIEKFQEELLRLTGPLETQGTDLMVDWNGGYVYGVHPQKQKGLNYVGLSVPLGRLTSDELAAIARCENNSLRGELFSDFVSRLGLELFQELLDSFNL